jgi:hypothetical protein
MASIFQIRRGTADISSSIFDGEIYLNKSKNSLQVSIGDGNPITLLPLNTASVGNINLSGDITASNANFTGDVSIGGNIFLGNQIGDNISALGVFTTNLVPGTTNLYNIGTTSSVWSNVYATSISGAIASTNGVISGSSQIVSILDSLNSFSSSQLSQNTALATISGSLISTASANTISVANLNSFSSSQLTQNIALATISGSLISTASANTISIAELNSYSSSLKDAITVSGSGVSSTTTIKGNLVVQGTQTTIDSTTLNIGDNIIELNGTGIANGGLLVKDPTGGSTTSGSLLWDSTLDYWKGGTLGNESKLLLAGGDSVISGSTQIANLGYATTGSNSFNGNQIISGNIYLTGSIIPSGSAIFDLGSDTHPFQHLYVGSGSIFLGGTKVFGSEVIIPQIGEYLEGGIVFHIADDQSFVLIADENDLTSSTSANLFYSFEFASNSTGSGIGDGLLNTNQSYLNNPAQTNTPIQLAYSSTRYGYSDWYLPSNEELQTLAENTNTLSGVWGNNRYWTSTVFNNNNHYQVDANQNNIISPAQFQQGYDVAFARAIRKSTTVVRSGLQTIVNQTISGSITMTGNINGVNVSEFANTTNNRLNIIETTYVTTSSLNTYTASLNTYTTSVDSRFTTLASYTASVNQTTASLNLFSASINTFSSSIFTDFSNSYDAVSESFDYRITTLDPGNIGASITSLNSFTSSANTRLNSIEAATSSYETNGRGIVSGSSQIVPLLPTGVVSGSSQIVPLLPTGVVSGSSQIVPLLPTGVVSGSIQVLGGSTIHSGSSGDYQFNSIGVGTAASTVAGEIRATADITAFYSSDIRLKENIHPILHALEKVKSISGNTYDWKEGFDEIHSHKGNDIGVIAQEIEAVLPQIVTNRDNGYKAVQYEKIIPLLVEAIKELSAKIDRLENK